MVEGTKIDPKIPDDEEDSLDLKSSKVKEEDDAVFLFPSITSLKNLFVEYNGIYIHSTTTFREKLSQEKKNGEKKYLPIAKQKQYNESNKIEANRTTEKNERDTWFWTFWFYSLSLKLSLSISIELIHTPLIIFMLTCLSREIEFLLVF